LAEIGKSSNQHIMDTIGFIGGGRVTRIFLKAFENSGQELKGISVFDPNPVVLENLETLFPGIDANADDLSKAAGSSMVFLAVHPPFMMETLTAIKPLLDSDTIIVSLAPKFTIEKIASVLGDVSNIARINPSASSYINQGINPVCYAHSMNADARASLVKLMKPLGAMPEVEENKIEAYAMISAMGHTYFWFQIQKLKELAVGFGMNEEEAKQVITGMMDGTVKTLFDSGLDYEDVIDLVPVKPLAPVENVITGFFDDHLVPLFNKIKP
jgi:pyrroline-5-carboxylate reductase